MGVASTQATHAAIDFQYEHPEIAQKWQRHSNYLALLTTENEETLTALIVKATMRGIKHTIFREPDRDNQITAVAFEPSIEAQKLTSSLPLFGKEVCHG